MAFSYEGLQKITGEGLVDTTIVANDVAGTTIDTPKFDTGAITGAKLANNSIPAGDVADGAVIASKLGSNSIDLAGTKVGGALAGSKGGTGLAYRTLRKRTFQKRAFRWAVGDQMGRSISAIR